MYERILVPVDGSESSDQALAAALRMAALCHARVRLVHVVGEVAHVNGYALHLAREHGNKVLDAARSAAAAAQVDADGRLLDSCGRELGEAIAQTAREWEADLVVVGTHGRRGLEHALLGSGAEQVIRRAPVPVLVVRHRGKPTNG